MRDGNRRSVMWQHSSWWSLHMCGSETHQTESHGCGGIPLLLWRIKNMSSQKTDIQWWTIPDEICFISRAGYINVIRWHKIYTFKFLNPAIHTVECDFQREKKKKTFLPAILCPCSEQDFSLWSEQKKRSEAAWLKKPWRGVVTVIYIYSLPRHLGGCYPGGLCWSSQKHSHLFLRLTVSIDTGWLWFSHIKVVSHVLLTVKTGWADAGTWMPSGRKHYYTFWNFIRPERTLYQRF